MDTAKTGGQGGGPVEAAAAGGLPTPVDSWPYISPIDPRELGLGKEQLLEMYYYMQLQRLAEERIVRMYAQGKISGACFTGRGHEAIAVGESYPLQDGDVIAPLHRDLAARFVRGMPVRAYFANFLGRAYGTPTRGRDGNLHVASLEWGTFNHADHLGSTIPLAAGAALSFKLRKQPRVAVAPFGEGTPPTGEFHEGANFAAVLKLPLVLVCWNNQFAYSTPASLQMAIPDLRKRAEGYGMPGELVDGNDVLAVYRAVKAAVDRARRGGGPSLIECVTMRLRGHSEADDASYVPKGLLAKWQEREPVGRFHQFLLERDWATEEELEQVRQRALAEVEEAAAWAEEQPRPPGEWALGGVYCEDQPVGGEPEWRG